MDMRMKTDSDVSISSSGRRTILLLEVISVLGKTSNGPIMAKSSIYVNICKIRAIMMQA